jgi:acyl dehydratase
VNPLRGLVGRELGPSAWIDVTQDRIDAFAAATGDPQWIHVDRERAAAGPFGTTIAHGYLTLALTVPMLDELLPPADGMVLNYGVDRVRFPAPVPEGGRVRGRFRVVSVADSDSGERATLEAVLECDVVDKPVCVAQLIVLTVS